MAKTELTDFASGILFIINYENLNYLEIFEKTSKGTKFSLTDKKNNIITYHVCENINKVITLLEIGLH